MEQFTLHNVEARFPYLKLQVMATMPDALKSSPDVWSPIIRLIITEAQTV